jgi:hypothetical protein
LGSILITIVLLTSAAFISRIEHKAWDGKLEVGYEKNWECCKNQKDYLLKTFLKRREENKEAAEDRIEKIKEIRVYSVTQSWDWFEKEISRLDKIKNKLSDYKIAPPINYFTSLLPLILLTFIFYLGIERLILLHLKSIQHQLKPAAIINDEIPDWILPHIIFIVLIAGFMIFAEISTSILSSKKTWFSWDSFCITPSAFIIKCSSFFSFGSVAATPFTILWHITRKENIPDPNSYAYDGKFNA